MSLATTRTPRTGRPTATAEIDPCVICKTLGGRPGRGSCRPSRTTGARFGIAGSLCSSCYAARQYVLRACLATDHIGRERDPDPSSRRVPPDPADDARLVALMDGHPPGVAITEARLAALWGMTTADAMAVVGRLLVKGEGACCPVRRVVETPPEPREAVDSMRIGRVHRWGMGARGRRMTRADRDKMGQGSGEAD